MSQRLPVFPLSAAPADAGDAKRLAAALFGADRPKLEEHDGASSRARDRSSSKSTAEWRHPAADRDRLWNASQQPKLVSDEQAYESPASCSASSTGSPARRGRAFALTQRVPGDHVASERTGLVPSAARRSGSLRVGFATRASKAPSFYPSSAAAASPLTLGDGGRPIGFHGLWRPAGEAEQVEAIDAEEAQDQFPKLMHLEIAVGDRSSPTTRRPSRPSRPCSRPSTSSARRSSSTGSRCRCASSRSRRPSTVRSCPSTGRSRP